jgi:hypothetical protein
MSKLDEFKVAILSLSADERVDLLKWLVRLVKAPHRRRVIRYTADKKILAAAAWIRQNHDALVRKVVA